VECGVQVSAPQLQTDHRFRVVTAPVSTFSPWLHPGAIQEIPGFFISRFHRFLFFLIKYEKTGTGAISGAGFLSCDGESPVPNGNGAAFV
jgi:hypothetical protein